MSGAMDGLADIRRAAARRFRRAAMSALLLLVFLVLLSVARGAISMKLSEVLGALSRGLDTSAGAAGHDLVVMAIRLPRTVLVGMVGAALALCGAVMQGLFRNPLADPGLVGVSSGAALAAGLMIVLGDAYLAPHIGKPPFVLLPLAAFCGGLAFTLLLYAISTREGRTSVATLLLAGLALGALAGAVSGFLSYLSDDRQLRDLTFWALGSFSGASWTKVMAVAPILLPPLLATPFLARGLNALALGEAEAFHLGLPVQRIKTVAILAVALSVGASVAAAGIIGFVGIVVPHLIRLTLGADHEVVLPLCALGGACLLLAADIAARTLMAPAELPIGIITALIGAPFFLWLLLRRGRGIGL